jgi:hypothetical protein
LLLRLAVEVLDELAPILRDLKKNQRMKSVCRSAWKSFHRPRYREGTMIIMVKWLGNDTSEFFKLHTEYFDLSAFDGAVNLEL